jgi:putative ABC transport system substrate-binding protein
MGSLEAYRRFLPMFQAGLGESGYVEGRNVSIEYHWLEGQFDRLPRLMRELVFRRVAVIVTPTGAAVEAKAAATTTPIVFGAGEDPVRLGLVASLPRPGGNATGMNFFSVEAASKRLELLNKLVPTATRVAVLVNPRDLSPTELTLRDVQDAAPRIGVSTVVLKASTSREIEEAFAFLARERIEALYIGGGAYFTSRIVQLATLAAGHRIAAAYSNRAFAQAGGLMAYGTDFAELFHQIGAYTGRILKGARASDLPVVQSTKFEFVINVQTARLLGIQVPEALLATADEVIE